MIIVGVILLFIAILGQTEIGNRYEGDVEGFKFVNLLGESIRYIQQGAGHDILLIHGTPGSIEDWRLLMDSLVGSFRVTAFDRPGQGYSSSMEYEYHIIENASMVIELIDKLNLESPIIVGHSYGGSTIAHLLTSHYDDDLSYIMIDAPLFRAEADAIFKLLSIPILGKGIALAANFTIAENQIIDGITSALVNQTPSQLDKIISERKEIWMQPKVLYGKAKESVNYQSDLDEIAPNYKGISSDVVVITGEDNSLTFKDQAKRFSDIVKTDSLVVLSGTGHYIQLDRPNDIIAVIKNKMR